MGSNTPSNFQKIPPGAPNNGPYNYGGFHYGAMSGNYLEEMMSHIDADITIEEFIGG